MNYIFIHELFEKFKILSLYIQNATIKCEKIWGQNVSQTLKSFLLYFSIFDILLALKWYKWIHLKSG